MSGGISVRSSKKAPLVWCDIIGAFGPRNGFAFGETDAFVVVDMPDNNAMIAASAAINSSGAVQTKTIVLLTAEEMDEAVKKTVKYKAPGQ